MQFRASIACLLTISFLSAVGAQANVVLQETPLGDASAYEPVKAVTFSTDSRHLAFLGVKGDSQFVVRDGVPSKPYDWVIPDSLAGPLSLTRLGFIIQNGNDMAAIVDGQVAGSGYYFVGADRITFSDDGKHYAYTVRRGSTSDGKAFVIRDGVEGKPYVAAAVVPTFSPDGNHLAYTASPAAGKVCMVADDKEDATYDAIIPGTTTFSPDSKHLSYSAVLGGKFVAVIDGKASKPCEQMRMTPIYSPDSSRNAYIAGTGGKLFAVVDGIEGPQFDGFTDGSVVFSPDSKHIAYAARKGTQTVMLLDGKEQKGFDAIAGESIHFSPDSTHLVYVGITNKQRFVIFDETPGKPYDNVLWPGPIFSPDSKRVTFAGAHDGKLSVVTDGIDGPAYDNVAELSFTVDGKRVVYRAVSKGKALVVIDGKESQPFDNTTLVAFSTDCAHYAFVGQLNSECVIWIDGVATGKTYSAWVKGTRPSFSEPSNVDFLMVRDRHFLQVHAHLDGSPTGTTPPAAR
jgi:Tol biopolymer transport system component